MFDNIHFSQLSVGKDISEVRNQIDSIRQYLIVPTIQVEIFDFAVKKMKEIKEKQRLEVATDEDPTNLKAENTDMFSKFESMPEAQKKHLSSFASMLATNFANILADAIQTRPMRVNFMQIMLVEMWFSISNTRHEPIPSYKIIDGKLQIYTKNKEERPKERLEMMLGDVGRKLHIMKEMTQNYDAVVEQSTAIFTGNMPSTDPLFGQYFALTFSQCSVYDVQEFLDYQKEQYHRDFNSFLSITLLKYKDLLTEEHIVLAQEWLSKSVQQAVEPQQAQQVQIETESVASDVLFKHTNTAINGKLSDKEIHRFFDFLHEQKTQNKQPFLSKEQVEQLKTIGLTLPNDEPSLRFTLNLTNRDYKTIYTCFYELWKSHHFAKNGGKDAYAKFLKAYFTDFDKTQLATVQNSLQAELPTVIGFNIKSYLPNFD